MDLPRNLAADAARFAKVDASTWRTILETARAEDPPLPLEAVVDAAPGQVMARHARMRVPSVVRDR